jgi:hypothetical protein
VKVNKPVGSKLADAIGYVVLKPFKDTDSELLVKLNQCLETQTGKNFENIISKNSGAFSEGVSREQYLSMAVQAKRRATIGSFLTLICPLVGLWAFLQPGNHNGAAILMIIITVFCIISSYLAFQRATTYQNMARDMPD